MTLVLLYTDLVDINIITECQVTKCSYLLYDITHNEDSCKLKQTKLQTKLCNASYFLRLL